jgi:serine/threonine protein kinase
MHDDGDENEGQGHFSKVYKGKKLGTNEAVAIKVANDGNEVMSNDEAAMLKNVQGPGVIKLIGTEPHNGGTKIITPYAEHGTLYDYFQTGNASNDERKQFKNDLNEGLKHLHGQKIAHNDLKPVFKNAANKFLGKHLDCQRRREEKSETS